MLKRFLPLLGTVACFASGSFPTTWEGRYGKAAAELNEAQDDLNRFYALRDAAKAAFEVGKTDEARQHAQSALDLAPRFPGRLELWQRDP